MARHSNDAPIHGSGCRCSTCFERGPSDPNTLSWREMLAITAIIVALIVMLPHLANLWGQS